MRTVWMNRFVHMFWAWLISIAVTGISLIATGGDDDFLIVILLMAVVQLILQYIMFYALCVDIIDKKGYTTYEIPLLRITFFFGLFIFFYIISLTNKDMDIVASNNKHSSKQPSAPEKKTLSENKRIEPLPTKLNTDIWYCSKCNYKNHSHANYCKNCGTENTTRQSTWQCPKCAETNKSSIRMCKNCGYQR